MNICDRIYFLTCTIPFSKDINAVLFNTELRCMLN